MWSPYCATDVAYSDRCRYVKPLDRPLEWLDAPPESGPHVMLNAAKIGVRAYMKRPVPIESASAFLDEKIKELGDWRGKTLAKVRKLIREADPEIVEERKWV